MNSEDKKRRQREASNRYRFKHPDRIKATYKTRRDSGKTPRYSRIRRQEIRESISKLKAETPCKDCGHNFPPECMDFDHLGDKKIAVSHLISNGYRLEAVMAEVRKCEIICACCHRIRTQKRMRPLLK